MIQSWLSAWAVRDFISQSLLFCSPRFCGPCIFVLLACSLSMGIFSAVKKVLCLASAMECADGDKIVFTEMPLR